MSEDDPVSRREFDKVSNEWREAIKIKATDLDRRLDGHDKDINATKGREVHLHTREAHDDFVKNIEQRFKELYASIKPQWVVWVGAAGVFVTATIAIAAGIWTLGVGPIKEDYHRLDTLLQTHITSDAESQKRDDALRDQVRHNGEILQNIQQWISDHRSMKK